MSPPALPAYCIALLSLKSTSELTFAEISEKIAKPEVWTTSLFFGQARTDKATAEALLNVLSAEGIISYLDEYTGEEKMFSPSLILQGLTGGLAANGGMVQRGSTWEWPPKDPVIYRLYEVLVVYGWSYKALIHEKFGDGIMSAIGFRTSVEKKKDETGDRVVITLDGKFLPYSTTDQWDMSAST